MNTSIYLGHICKVFINNVCCWYGIASRLFTQLMPQGIMIILLRIDFLNWIWKGFIYAQEKI